MTDTMDTNTLLAELARILNVTDIDASTLQLCTKLIDQGVDPKKLASAIKNIKNETQSVAR
ncbi:CIC11C00000001143 [Sungouiella intermedia]|uniref:CIC11C00000001143 n=1 Tax=Sungouiella intermedia TaxID=45354 RepID=A0A1L0D389_9ASCO|nr:CIC11C00000001143 [[Candida] intermedia]